MTGTSTNRAIRLAERILSILEEGSYTATYKYAVLLALLDLCMASTAKGGAAPSSITTRQLAEAVVELYWPHTMPFGAQGPLRVLKQNASHQGSQAEILRRIEEFRARHAPDASATLMRSRLRSPDKFDNLVKAIEWKLIEMPLARLQVIGGRPHHFLYHISWSREDTEKKRASQLRERVRAYQRDESGDFDNRLLFADGVAADLVLLNGLLRPLIHRRWAAMVARLNNLEESRLEEFLFGTSRISLTPLRSPLHDLQSGRCFYCGRGIRGAETAEVDHFIPWSRYPDNGLGNLVVAHRQCNAAKRDHLAAEPHLRNWLERIDANARLPEIAKNLAWEYRPERSLGVSRAIYHALQDDTPLWLRKDEFLPTPRLSF